MSGRAFARIGIAALLVLLGACSRGSDGEAGAGTSTVPSRARPTTTADLAPARCDPARPLPEPAARGTLAFGGVERRYTLHLPPAYDGVARLPLVLDFHGYGSSAGVQLVYSGITPVADREGFAVVAPEGQGSPPHFTLLGATATEADDAEFTVALLDHLQATLCLDPDRAYALGMSNGGALSSVLACRAGDRIAAVGAVAAIVYLPQPCEDAKRVAPIAAMMGTEDPVVPFAGGRVNCCGNPSIPAAPATMAQFATRSGCDAEPASRHVGESVEHRSWQGCDDGGAVDFYVVEGGGHTWPGAGFDVSGRGLGRTTPDLVATEVLWSFFERHRLPAS